ncbi:bifunctional metallophosphatase/5'-nucleotidase [Paenibacillus crassostreae]|uniref:Multifunctional 2',3'-cyclic-nucleotide 2'-phosphodiesterase/5'-nucleotidase/3'-nucleotidase n=1 Tax=Paenibacillus crassostreae TaxID=1763538 RepID=A0A167G1T6_9BACL|nr:5'-nucleotidase C-terminal domain-containing protein [Paenibacillus crassostreae]AOZ93843.1 multifunctional 2',3'-cyclic-nucleotide 2'-phosphodiesterase/5'-nucleotidase/3'-nucleotidase [Paenibacillus crassostreae]OAB77123.1 multifunctional 2',3'-cyclic-nucleotide 2'-phosphodiesterase/5'-nucleotidase/3'-nucleotidase [Paenibacillus crassostreae]
MPSMDKDRLTILHTNDIHSHFEMVSSIAALVGRERELATDGALLLLDIGDHMDRMAVETEGSAGRANVDIINLTNYDAITIGNNEGLTFTPDMLEIACSGLLCPVVCSNIREIQSGRSPIWMKEHIIITKGNIKIGIIGATAPYHEFYRLLGWEALDPEIALKEQLTLLRPQVDIIIVLSHLGLPADQKLASRLTGIDLILGGHTHHLLEKPLQIGNTTICGAGKFGQHVGKVIMERHPDGTFRVVQGECILVDPKQKDINITNATEVHRKQAVNALQRVITVINGDVMLNEGDQESPFGNLLAQSLHQFTKSELSLVNTGQLLGSLPAGEITAGILHQLCPSPINSCVLKLKGSDIRYTLEQSLLSEYKEKMIKGYGFRGNVLGSIAIDGGTVLYDEFEIPFQKIKSIIINGIPLCDDQEYLVGTIDMFIFGGGYERIAKGRDRRFILPEFLRDLLSIELQRPSSLRECHEVRWNKIR